MNEAAWKAVPDEKDETRRPIDMFSDDASRHFGGGAQGEIVRVEFGLVTELVFPIRSIM
jgi:hypothetical protein